ncbi:MAG: leucine-rich repeat protein [Bacilli bacterium]
MKFLNKKVYIFISLFIFIACFSIGYGAFSQTLNINATADIINSSDFIYNYLPYNQTMVITGYKGSSTNVVIPTLLDGFPVKVIDKYSFKDSLLSSVSIPEGIETLHYGSFMNNQLKELILPSSLSTIDNEVFVDNNLEIVSFREVVPPEMGNKVFDNNYHLINICIPSTADEVLWANALAKAGVNTNPNLLVNPVAHLIKGKSGACAIIGTGEVEGPPPLNCGVNAYQLGNACVCFDQYEGDPYTMCSLKLELTCFEFIYQAWSKYNVIKSYKCDNKNIVIPDIVDGVHTGKINKDAFKNMGITSIVLNDYLQILDMYSFKDNLLRSVTIPKNVDSIILNSFTNNKLESVIFKGDIPPTMNNKTFTDNPALKKICVPTGKTSAYTSALNGSGIPSDAVIYENETACKIN